MVRILLVDDEYDIVRGLKETVNWKRAGAKIAGVAGNGLEALRIIGQVPVDFVITDVKMPVMDGIELAKHINSEYPHIRLIILSGYTNFSFAQKAIEFGVSRYLVKPVDIEELIKIIKEDSESNPRSNLGIKFNSRYYPESFSPEAVTSITTRRALQYIEKFFSEKINLEQVASFVQKSPNYFSAKFRQDTGYNFTYLLTFIRIKVAEHLLIKTEETIDCIAFAVGFTDAGYFVKLFKKHHNSTPGEYRQRI